MKLSSLKSLALIIVNRKLLHPVDCLFLKKAPKQLVAPPIFIIGAPRSGSTLLTQILVKYFNLNYISNKNCLFFGMPQLVEYLPNIKQSHDSEFKSTYGNTKGIHSPSECGEYWYRFFRRTPTHVGAGDVSESKMQCFRSSISRLTSKSGQPILFKNLYAGLRLPAICKYIPEALYIQIKRNEHDNALSILHARKKHMGSYDKWFSFKPPNIEALKNESPAKQVIEQVRCVYNIVQNEIQENPIFSNHIHTIQYESLCHDVLFEMKRLNQFFATHGVRLSTNNDVPVQFNIAPQKNIDCNIQKELQSLLSS